MTTTRVTRLGDQLAILLDKTLLDEVVWGADGWPTINNGQGPSARAASPFGARDMKAEHRFFDITEELALLVDTAGADVVGRLSQQVATPNPATLIGE